MSNASELPDKLLSSGTSEIHRDCGITVPPHPLRETLWDSGEVAINPILPLVLKSLFLHIVKVNQPYLHIACT